MKSSPSQKKMLSRRQFLSASLISAFGIGLLSGCARQKTTPEIVVVGGGVGGISFIRALLGRMPDARITLIEPSPIYHACPLSSHVLADLLPDNRIRQSYINIESLPNVRRIPERAENIAHDSKTIVTSSGATIPYDKLVVSPGISLMTQGIEHYDGMRTPHGWKNDDNLFTLKAQLRAMDDGGLFLLTAPQKPYRCSPAPYERAGLVASYLKAHKPASKLMIIDQKTGFPQQELFFNAWNNNFGGMVEWVTGDFVGAITAFHPDSNTVETEFDSFRGDVINLIPDQRADTFAAVNGLTNASGWCPVDLRSMKSTLFDDIYVIGDAIENDELPKAASISFSQANVAAENIAAEFNGQSASDATFESLCWSATHNGQAVKVVGGYHVEGNGALVRDSLALSSFQDTDAQRADNYAMAKNWNTDLFASLYGAQ